MEARSTNPDQDTDFTVPKTTIYCNQGLPPRRAPTPGAVIHNLTALQRAETVKPTQVNEQSNPQGE